MTNRVLSKIKDNWLTIIIIIQPILDIISYFQTKYLGNSYSWIARIIILMIILIITYYKSRDKKKLILFLLPYCIFFTIHILNLYRIDTLKFLVDLKYFINTFQTPIITILLIDYVKSTDYNLEKIKKSIVINFFIIAVSIGLAYITNTFQYTYTSGRGITGWFSSANTIGMILCALSPWTLYMLSKTKKWYYYLISIIVVFANLYFNATKACYFTLVLSLMAMTFALAFSKDEPKKTIKIIITVAFLIISILLYNVSYTSSRSGETTDINKSYNQEIQKITMNNDKEIINLDNIDTDNDKLIEKILSTSYIYREIMDIQGKDAIIKAMKPHLSASALANNRLRKVINAQIEFEKADVLTKTLGIGYSRIAAHSLDLENDLHAIYYYYGYWGFVLYLSIYIYAMVKSLIAFLKNPKLIYDKEFIMLIFLILILIVGGEYSGAFLRKANANIYLSLFLIFLFYKIKKKSRSTENNKITFLLLHLGFGGIETATINTANALSKKFNVELIVYYYLKNNQEMYVNKNINIKYLYRGEPNKNQLKGAVKSKNILALLKEGIKALNIVMKKQILMKKEIINSTSFAIISTRSEFSKILSKYGPENVIKIAQEHQHHNNDKKYINVLKYKYKNIDYLLALTKGLKKDYEEFLIKNKHTKIVLVPNMLVEYNHEKSNLDNKNIITISRLHKGKRIEELVEIFSKIKNNDSLLYIIGDGEEKDNIEKFIKEKKLENRIIMTGYLNREEQKEYILKTSVFAMTSISEGLPMVLLEAMSYGLPCIAYKTESGVEDIIVNNVNGYIIKNRNQKEYIEKLTNLLENQKQKQAMSTKALEKIDKYKEENVVKIWLEILKKMD